jgi:hypothetical protein
MKTIPAQARIRLWEAWGVFLIVPYDGGIIYENQVSVTNDVGEARGILMPLPSYFVRSIEVGLEAIFRQDQVLNLGESEFLVPALNALFSEFRMDEYLSLDPDRLNESTWKWLHVLVNEIHDENFMLHEHLILGRTKAIMTWGGNVNEIEMLEAGRLDSSFFKDSGIPDLG